MPCPKNRIFTMSSFTPVNFPPTAGGQGTKFGELPAMGSQVLNSSSDSSSPSKDECLRKELHGTLVPSALRVPWIPVHLYFYYIRCTPIPDDRQYRMFGLFLKSPLPEEVETMQIDLHLHHSRIAKTTLVPSGMIKFDRDEIILAEKFQEMSLKIILDPSIFESDYVPLGEINEPHNASSTFYLFLPVKTQSDSDNKVVDWETVRNCLVSPVFGSSFDSCEDLPPTSATLKLRNGTFKKCDIINSLAFTPHNKCFYLICNIDHEKKIYSFKSNKFATHEAYYKARFRDRSAG